MHSALNKLKFACVGTPLRIARLALSFLPIVGYVLPLAAYTGESGAGVIDEKSISLISFFTKDSLKIGALMDGASKYGSILKAPWFLPLAALALSLLLGVIAFFLIPILAGRPRQPVTCALHVLALGLYGSNLFLYPRFIASGGAAGGTRFGIYIGIALFVLALAADIAVLSVKLKPGDGKYVPVEDELQREYAVAAGYITPDEGLETKTGED